MSEKIKVAVYGSLRAGMGNHRLLEPSKLLGVSKVNGFNMVAYCASFPAVHHVHSLDDSIVTEVYEVDEGTFRELDWLEGYPNFYNRELVQTDFGEAWIYFMDDVTDKKKPDVPNGDWVKYYEERRGAVL